MSTGVINYGWYAGNSEQSYPFDPRSTFLDNNGVALPSSIVTDLSISCLGSSYEFIYVTGLSVNKGCVQLIISGRLKGTQTVETVLSFSSDEAVNSDTTYSLTSVVESVNGFITFGNFDQSIYLNSRYSSPVQVKVLERCIYSTSSSGIPYVSKVGTNLQAKGVIKIQTSNNGLSYGLEVPRGISPLPISLRNSSTALLSCISLTTADINLENSVLGVYANGINQVPESGQSSEIKAVQTIGHVQPNCNGNIIIRFNPKFIINPVEKDGEDTTNGVTVGTQYELDEICGERNTLPDSDGTLPGTPEDDSICPPDETEFNEVITVPQPWPPEGYVLPVPINYVSTLPNQIPNWTIFSGRWSQAADGTITINDTYSLATNNFGVPKLKRNANSISVSFQFMQSMANARYNVIAGLYCAPISQPLSLTRQIIGAVVNSFGGSAKDRVLQISEYKKGFWKPVAELILNKALVAETDYTITLTGVEVSADAKEREMRMTATLKRGSSEIGSLTQNVKISRDYDNNYDSTVITRGSELKITQVS